MRFVLPLCVLLPVCAGSEALATCAQVVPERTTFYGARELIVTDPAGNVVFFASH